MVNQVKIGVIGVQGAVSEHINMMKKALGDRKIKGQVLEVKNKVQLNKVQGLIIPGGESTTISRIIYNSGLYQGIKNKIQNNELAVMGTCAGCVILSEKIAGNQKDIKLLKVMNTEVQRNFFGRQKKSFEKKIKIKGFTEPYNAIFIRAPVITKVGNKCKILSKINEKIIMAQQEKILALSFHPELTKDLRIHKHFLDLI